jgi:hypothetical protein
LLRLAIALLVSLQSVLPVTSGIVDRAAIYIGGGGGGGQIYKYYLSPPPQVFLHRRAALCTNSIGTQPVYRRKNPKSIVYNVRCLCNDTFAIMRLS